MTSKYKIISHLATFLAGILTGFFFILAVAVLCLPYLAEWLVVDHNPQQVDAIVVLGGGGGSRLKRALELQDAYPQTLLILVGRKPDDWQRNARNCGSCELSDRKLVYLSGSTDTLTDATLVNVWCDKQVLRSIAVVTDPYHTRRADLSFKKALPGVTIFTTSSEHYNNYLKPAEKWWHDRKTLELVWGELGKIIYFVFTV